MKKLLAMLTTITSLSSITPIILANASAEIPENKIINKEINYQQTNNSENLKRNKRENIQTINNNSDEVNTEIYWVNSETNLKKETDVPGLVTTMYTFTSDSVNRKKGDIYFGTTNGVYLRKSGEITTTKINGIDGPIKLIQEYYNSNFLNVTLITNQGNIYYIGSENNIVYWQLDVPAPVTTMYTFTTDGGNRKKGDIYFGTTNGIYLRKSGEVTTTKINGIDGPIKLIQEYSPKYNYDLGSAHVITLNGDIYYVNNNNVVFKQNSVPAPVTTMYTFTTDGGNRKKGDIYFGTTNGIYLRKSGEVTITKINGIDGPIKLIQEYSPKYNYDLGSMHVITLNGDIYYVNNNNVVFKQNGVPAPVTTMYTFTTDGGNRKKGDIYFGTTNGIYLRKSGEVTTTKINGIDGPIKLIQKYSDNANNVHIITLILNKNILERRQDDNYKLVIDNSESQSRPVINYDRIKILPHTGNGINIISRGFNEYMRSFASITSDFYSTNNNNYIHNNNQNFLTLNPQVGHFILEVSFTESSSTSNRLELVFSRQNLYLEGFIVRRNNNNNSDYYYFSSASVTEINNVDRNTSLGFEGSYGALLGGCDLDISWDSTVMAFEYLQNFEDNKKIQRELKQNLANIILVTSEAMRFGNRILFPIGRTTQFDNEISFNENFYTLVHNWQKISDLARNPEMPAPDNSKYALTESGREDWKMFKKAGAIFLLIALAS